MDTSQLNNLPNSSKKTDSAEGNHVTTGGIKEFIAQTTMIGNYMVKDLSN